MSPRSERVARSRTIRQVLVEYMKAVGVNPCEQLFITVTKDIFNKCKVVLVLFFHRILLAVLLFVG